MYQTVNMHDGRESFVRLGLVVDAFDCGVLWARWVVKSWVTVGLILGQINELKSGRVKSYQINQIHLNSTQLSLNQIH
jgi:hypothetical protein